jgi:hypothetical protein
MDLKYTGCPEYYPQGLLGKGIDIQDVIALISPRAFLFIGGGADTINLIPSMQAACAAAAKVYALNGAADKIANYAVPKAPHGYDADMRQEMYRFMDRSLGFRSENVAETDHVEKAEDLNFLARTGYKTLADYEGDLFESNRTRWDPATVKKTILKSLLGLSNKSPVGHGFTESKRMDLGAYRMAEAVIETDRGIFIPISVVETETPKDVKKNLLLVFSDRGRNRLLEENPYRDEYKKGSVVAAFDVRGIGASGFNRTCWDQYGHCSPDRWIGSTAIALGYPIPGQRIFDIISVRGFLTEKYKITGKTRIVAEGRGASVLARIFALIAGIDPADVTADPFSYADLMRAHRETMSQQNIDRVSVTHYAFEYTDLVPGILKYFDIGGDNGNS